MNIGIIFGGISYEHEISIVSAIAMKKVINHNITYIFLDENRDFYLIPSEDIKANRFSTKEYLKKDKKLSLEKGGFYYFNMFKQKKDLEVNYYLNLVHGGDGEDGKLAAILEFFDMPFIGPRVESSVISCNKLLTKEFAKELGVKVIDYEVFNKSDNDRTLKHIDFPAIVKPVRLGSSIGVSVVHNKSELDYAFDVAFEFDSDVIVEPFFENIKEFNLAGCYTNRLIFSNIEEPQKEKYLDFDKKYLDFSRTSKVNVAQIDDDLKTQLKRVFTKVYLPFFKGAIIRCDFFYMAEQIYLNEINPIPGSMANYLFDDFNGVIEELVQFLPQHHKIAVEYKYINEIGTAKGGKA
jgi:D-alanine-D-alanine ligase